MLNTKKFLYIMPDSAYIAELLPTKKEHVFGLHVFHQINGDFITDDEFIAPNIEKLLKKVDPDEYVLILPDFLFTNTILDVAETSENEVKRYIKETLLPSLDITKETHEIATSLLTQLHGKSKVQLSALEKSLLQPIRKACAEQKIAILDIAPLTWTMKSAISLEPSLSAIQLGENLYIAEHYIGVDQAVSFKLSELTNIVDTVKTLKGTEPNIKTMYLVTNLLIENEIKEKLSGTLPIQQLANYADEKEGVPAYIQQIIESAAKTLDIPDFPVPRFSLGSYTPTQSASAEKGTIEKEVLEKEVLDNTFEEKSEVPAILPPPAAPPVSPEPVAIPVSTVKPLSLEEDEPTPPPTNVLPLGMTSEIPETKPYMNSPLPERAPDWAPERPVVATAPTPTKVILKNKSGVGSLFKVIGITLGALILTVIVGIGIGFGLLSFSQKSNPLDSVSPKPSSVAQSSATPLITPTPTPKPSPSPTTVAKEKVKVLVVNATKTAGKAGKIKALLTSAGYKSVETGNAQGTYTAPGNFVLMTAEDQAFISTLTKDSGLTLTYKADKDTEDSKAAYDIVIVINE